MKNNNLIVAALLIANFGITANDSWNRSIEETLKDQEYDAKAGNFFERSEKQKDFERFEYMRTPGNLTFFLTHDHLDPKLFGPGIHQDAKEFSRELQATIAKVIQGNQPIKKQDLYKISKHARQQCNMCADLELKRRAGKELGTVPAETTWYLLWPYVQGDAKKFYENACGEVYKDLSDERLAEIIEVTKQ
jgi:hypothetical protein